MNRDYPALNGLSGGLFVFSEDFDVWYSALAEVPRCEIVLPDGQSAGLVAAGQDDLFTPFWVNALRGVDWFR